MFIRLAMNDPTTQNIHDVVNMLERTYQSMKDYPRWEEDEDEVKESASKAKKQVPTQESQPTRKPDVSVYEAYDEFQEKHEIPENDESFFYAVFNAAAEAIFSVLPMRRIIRKWRFEPICSSNKKVYDKKVE